MLSEFLHFSQSVFKQPPGEGAIFCSRKKTFAVYKYKNENVLFLYGTKNLAEWANNLRYDGWRAASLDILTEYYTEFNSSPNYLVGFSRGAALALILAGVWKNANCLCLSCPKVAKEQLELLKMPFFIQTRWDFITMVPFWHVNPTPHIMLILEGNKHNIQALAKVPEWKLAVIENALNWSFCNVVEQ